MIWLLIPAALLAYGALRIAAWAASDEPYMKVAPFKPRDTQTKITMDDERRLIEVGRLHDQLRRERGHR